VITPLMSRLELGSLILIARAANRLRDALAPLSRRSSAKAACLMVHTGFRQGSPLVRLFCGDLFPLVLR
jgi:hypothetical protein